MTMALPTRFVATIGGFGGPHHEVRWQRGRLLYCNDDSEVSVEPSVHEWETFWSALDAIEI